MHDHATALRAFYQRELRHQPPQTTWTFEVVLEWFARLQIGAFAGIYHVVHKSQNRCPFCRWRRDAKDTFLVQTSWEKGAKMRCTRCGGGWVQLDD
jgi:hypothetical protein